MSGVEDAIAALSDDHPFLLRRRGDDKGKDDNPFRAGRSGRPVKGTARKAPTVPNRQSLAKKYPALRNRI